MRTFTKAFYFALYFTLAALLLPGISACSKQSNDSIPAQELTQEQANETPDDNQPQIPEHAHGLPLPPDAFNVHETPSNVRVESKMNLDELEAFFKSRVVDYEYFRPDPNLMHIIGLRSHQPAVRIRRMPGTHALTILNYRNANTLRHASDPSQREPTSAILNKIPGSINPPEDPRKRRGMPVLDRTPDGEFIAPGARWGEPYTPPENSPLADPANRSNYGMPYGQWTPY